MVDMCFSTGRSRYGQAVEQQEFEDGWEQGSSSKLLVLGRFAGRGSTGLDRFKQGFAAQSDQPTISKCHELWAYSRVD